MYILQAMKLKQRYEKKRMDSKKKRKVLSLLALLVQKVQILTSEEYQAKIHGRGGNVNSRNARNARM